LIERERAREERVVERESDCEREGQRGRARARSTEGGIWGRGAKERARKRDRETYSSFFG